MSINRRTACGVAILIWLVCEASAPRAQQPSTPQPSASQSTFTPTFRASVRWVDVDAVVRDKDGNFVTGLTKDDFEVFEDLQPQTLDRVTLVDLPPVTPAQAPLPEADPGDDFQDAGRIYVLVLDGGAQSNVRSLARQFIDDYLGPIDRMAVVNVHGRGDQGLTSDKGRLLEAVDQYVRGANEDPTLKQLRTTYATLKEVAVSLGAVTGRRKSILLIGQGVDLWSTRSPSGPYDPRPGSEDIDDLWRLVRDTTRTAEGFNVPIHVIKANMPLLPTGTGTGTGLWANPFAGAISGPQAPLAANSFRSAAQADRDSGLAVLAERTRGVRIINTNDYGKGFSKIVEQNSQYYMLGYYSNVEPDGRVHRITIRMKRPGLTVQGRQSFRSMNPEIKAKTVDLPKLLSTTARTALKGATAGTVPLATEAVVYRGEHFTASVLVNTSIKGTDLTLGNGSKLEYAAAAFDKWGRVIAVDRRAFSFTMRPQTRARLEANGVHLFSRMTLPTGTYDIRVMAQQPDGRMGLSSTSITVPDFTDRSLVISELIVGTPAVTAPLTLLADDTLRRAVTGTPGLATRLTTARNVPLFIEIFDTQWLISQALGVKWALRSETTGLVARQGEERADKSEKGRIYFRGALPLSSLSPGTYVLDIEVFSIGGPPAAATRQFRFEVVDG